MKTITERLDVLRQIMQYGGIAAYIIPSSDPHLSEYVAGHWKRREWISGFDGSAGTIVVLPDKAGLWTDSRYYLQAELQLEGSGIVLFREGKPETPDTISWIVENLKKGETIGIDGEMFSVGEVEKMKETVGEAGLELKTDLVLINEKWADLSSLPESRVFIYDEKFAGISISEKIKLIGQKLDETKTDILLLSALDEIAWTFNIRGTDIEYNPVTIAYALVDKDSACIFIDEKKISPEVNSYFKQNGIKILSYFTVFDVLSKLPPTCRIWIDKQKTNLALYNAIPRSASIVNQESPVGLLKAVKNETEIQGVRNAMVKDGVALTHAFYWLDKELEAGRKVTEIIFAEKLKECRAMQKDFFSESFATIAGYGAHGAIVHYQATKESDAELQPDNLFLVDSGANYLDGTTDITRTIIIGKITPQQKQDYTDVLKGHIALATVRFPEGTHGVQLDAFARRYLWDKCLNYGHGTGHGIGHFLSVHEGPQNIRIKDNGVPLKPGMLLSNEPGLYRESAYGIRLENVVLVKEYHQSEYGRFLELETLTLFPFELAAIDRNSLSEKEIAWLTNYNEMVYSELSSFLPEEEKNWLKNKTTFHDFD